VVERVTKIEMTFFITVEGDKSGDSCRVADGGGVDSMLQFQLKRGGNGMKRCQKMKQR
jgi:hypothetical protein